MSALTKVVRDPEMALLRVASAIGAPFSRRAEELTIPPVAPDVVERTEQAFNLHGSDKASDHSYAGLYAALLDALPPAPRVLEVGLGTNHLDVACNMGEDGTPGASLRAMRELRPDAELHGADIDRRILFTEPAITTHWVDQLRPSSLVALAAAVGGPGSCDLVVDDGLHSKRSNLNTFRALFPVLKPGGTYVVEDIDGSAIAMWRYVLGRRRLAHAIVDGRSGSGYDIDVAVVIRSAASAPSR